MSMNRIVLLGNLTNNPELRYTQSNKPNARFSIAVQRDFKNKDGKNEVDYINCVAWGRDAEFICKYFKKGSGMALEGRLQIRTWIDDDNKKNYMAEVIVGNAYFAGKKSTSEDFEGGESQFSEMSGSENEGELPF